MNADSPQNSSGNKLLSIVLPVYDEETILPLLAAKIAKSLWSSGLDYEVIFVNDGSRDESGKLLDELAATSKRIRVVHLSRNFGQQAAFQAGIEFARGDAVVLMDSDLQDAPDAIPKMVAQWQAGYEVVYAVRSQRKSLWKRISSSAFHRLMSRTTSFPLPVDAGNFCLIDRRVAQSILALGEKDCYLPGLRAWVGFKQIGIEVDRNARHDGKPRVTVGGRFHKAKTAMFSFSTMPFAVFQSLALAAAAVFMGLGGFAIIYRFSTGWTIPGWTSAALVGSFFTLLNSVGICVLGEYLVRIYDQVRNRPLFIVDRMVNMETRELKKEKQSQVLSLESKIIASEEDFSGDDQYLALMDEAMSLLQTSSSIRETALPLVPTTQSADYGTQAYAGLE